MPGGISPVDTLRRRREPRLVDVTKPKATPYPGWPLAVTREGNYAGKALAWLPWGSAAGAGARRHSGSAAETAPGRSSRARQPPSTGRRDGQRFPGTVGYVGLDAFAVPTRGRGGVDWKMLYVGLLDDPPKEHTLYLVDYDFERLAGLLLQYAIALGFGRAERVVALTDGGNGLERVLRQGVSDAVVCVLDWWHLSEKLHELSGLLHERDPATAQAWAQARETTLWEQGGAALVAELDRLGCPPEATPAATERWQEVRNHVDKNAHRTAYPEYRGRGWDVSSGPTEAGCKVVGQRVKGAGRRWLQGNSLEVAALKALYASGLGLWEAFWTRRKPGYCPEPSRN